MTNNTERKTVYLPPVTECFSLVGRGKFICASVESDFNNHSYEGLDEE